MVTASTFRSTVRMLGLQYCLFRYSLAGLVSSQARLLSRAIQRAGSLPSPTSDLPAPVLPPALAHFSAADYEWLGFDLDHTLVAYKQVRRRGARLVKGPGGERLARAARRTP